MSKKRPTESSWESDAEILLEDTGVGSFSRKDDEFIDEDALLGIGESTDNAFNNDLSYEIQLDDSAAALFDITGESQEDLDYEDTYQEGGDSTVEPTLHVAYSDGKNQALIVDSKPNYTTTKLQISKVKSPGNESDNSDSEEEKKGRGRFKTERQTSTMITTKHTDIPDKLEVTKEMQDQIETFEKQKNQKGRQNQHKQKNQQQRQFYKQGQINRHNAWQNQSQRPGAPRGPFMHQQRVTNPNIRLRQPMQRGPGHYFPHGFPPGLQSQSQRPLMQKGIGPFPHEVVGHANFSAPQQFSHPNQMIHSGPGILQTPGSSSQFNPAPASLVAPSIHVNPKFKGSHPEEPHQHQPPHSIHHSPYPGTQPIQQHQPPGFMQGQRFQLNQSSRPLLSTPQPGGIESPRPLIMQQHLGPRMNNRGPRPQGQPMFLLANPNQVPQHNIPAGQFIHKSGDTPNMSHPYTQQNPPKMQPRHRHLSQNLQQQQHSKQLIPQHPGPHQQGQQHHLNQNNVRPQRFQHPNQQLPGPTPSHSQPNQNFNPQSPQNPPKPDPDLLAKQREIEERKKKRLERFSQNTLVVPSSDKPTTVKLTTGNKRPSLDGNSSTSPAKLAKLDTNMVVDNMDVALEIQKRQREKIRQLKEAKRQQEAVNRRKQLEKKLAKEGKTLADIEPQHTAAEQHQSIPTISGGQQFHPQQQYHQHQQQNQVQQQLQQHHQAQHHQAQQHNLQQHQIQHIHQHQHNQQQLFQNTQRDGGVQSERGQTISVRSQGEIGRPGLRKKTIPQGQPISVLGQTSHDSVVPVNVRGQGRGQFKGRGRGSGQTRPAGHPRSNILQTVQITEEVEISPVVTQNPQRTVLPARQVENQLTAVGMNSMGAASQSQKTSARIVVANKAVSENTSMRTVLSNTHAQRRVVRDSSLPSGSSSVAIEGLSSNVNLGMINGYCSSTGEVKNFSYKATERKILVRFANPGQAAKFIKKYNRQMVDLTMIRVKQVPDF